MSPAALAAFLRRTVTISITALTARSLLVRAEALIEGGLTLIGARIPAHLTALEAAYVLTAARLTVRG